MNPPKRAKLELDVNNLRASILKYAMTEFLTEPDVLYAEHMREEEERIAREQYAQVLALEEEEMLYLAMSGMSLSTSSLPCPICFAGELRQMGNSTNCTHCEATTTISLQNISNKLDILFQQHAMQCPSVSRISIAQHGEWVLQCPNCAMHANVF